MIKEENILPKFDEVGNLITKNPKSNKIEELEKELDELINGKEVFCCKYCGKEWDKKRSNEQHERWCPKNPNPRKYRTTSKSKKPKAQIKPIKREMAKPKVEPKREIIKGKGFTINELREIDNVFGLTDEQIVNYIRGKERDRIEIKS